MTIALPESLRCLTQAQRADLARALAHPTWSPDSLPQILAMVSQAEVVGYGGAAGGGKTDLLLGLALTQHRRSIIFRRESTQLVGLEDRSREMVGMAGQYNGSKRLWRGLPGGRVLEFGAVQKVTDWTKYQGRPHDLIGFDEAANFVEIQVRSLMGWNRTTVRGQRCRVVMAFNPPTSAEGAWIIDYFAPWLDRRHPHPAGPGELRWYVVRGGKDTEVDGPEPVEVDGKMVAPQSRTFVPARVEDNRHLMATGYAATLDALPEPLRSMMRHGDMTAGQADSEWQVIPTAWVEAAQARWTPERPRGMKMSALGVDVARGGKDFTILTPRYGHWFGEQHVYPGTVTPDGPTVAGLVVANLRDGAPTQVDVIGVGASVYDHLRGMGLHVVAMHGAEAAHGYDRSARLQFRNRRAELWWRMREALDPATGSDLALPPGRELLADLCAPRWHLQAGKVLVESKNDIIDRLGRSPDRGDSAVYALPDNGARQAGPIMAQTDYDPFRSR